MKKIISIILILLLSTSPAFSDWWWHREHRDFHHERFHERFVFRHGHFFRGEVIVPALFVGAVIEALPPCRIVIIDGRKYWFDGTYYYQESPEGWIVVSPPRVVKVIIR